MAVTVFFLLVAIGLADLQCLPGLFDPARAASANAVLAIAEISPFSVPHDLNIAVVISGTVFVAAVTVTLGSTLLEQVG